MLDSAIYTNNDIVMIIRAVNGYPSTRVPVGNGSTRVMRIG